MRVYKDDNEFYIGRVYFRDGHREGILEITFDDNGCFVIMTETDRPYPEKYISVEHFEDIPTEFNTAGYFRVKKRTFWKYDPRRIDELYYVDGTYLIDDENAYVPAAIEHIELYTVCK